MILIRTKLFFFALLFISTTAIAENTTIDSLLLKLKIVSDDTNKVNILYHLSELCESDSDVLKYAQEALALSLKLDYKRGLADAYNNIGYVYSNRGQVKQALELFMFSLKLQEELNNKFGIGEALTNISVIYNNQGQKEEALDYNMRALRIFKEINDKARIATTLNNIGTIHNSLGKQDTALKYCFSALKMNKEINNIDGVVLSLFSIGNIYNSLEKLDTALNYYFKSLDITSETSIRHYYTSINMNNIGFVYFKQRKYVLAEKYCLTALQIADSSGYSDVVNRASSYLSEIYSALGNYKRGLEMHILFKKMSDSLRNKETEQISLKRQMEYEFALKEAEHNAAHKNELTVAEEKEKQQIIINYAVLSSTLLILLFSAFTWNRLKITRKQKKIIDQKNKNITDSINYARLIQTTMMPHDEMIKTLFNDYFILYKPKDIVSGDFYWMEKKGNKVFFAVADCTGHGVPGAFMSIIGNTLLNEIINVKEVFEPDDILNHLKQGVIKILNQTNKGNTHHDGMEIGLCVFDKIKKTLSFSGANHILYHFQNNILREYQGDKQSINFERGKKEPFTKHVISIVSSPNNWTIQKYNFNLNIF